MEKPLQISREAEQHFGQLIAAVQDYAVFLLGPTGEILTWNLGAQRLNGYSSDEIIGQRFTVFYADESRQSGWPEHELREAARLGRFEDEAWRVRKDGTRFWANVIITALHNPDGSLRGFLTITRDFTERKLAEERLRQSEEGFRLLVEGVRDYAIYLLDTEAAVVSWNAGAERIKGYTADEIIGKSYATFFSAEDAASGKPRRLLSLAKSQGRAEDEGWRVRKDGSHFWAHAIITTLYDKEGNFRGYAKLTRDMTERRRMEALQVADRHKNEFLAALAHELRNPLAPLSNGLQLLKVPGVDAETSREVTEMMERQLSHLVRLIDDLLDVSRIVNGKITLQKEPLEVRTAIERACELVQPTLDARGHELMVTLPSRSLVVRADLVRISQVVSNLLTNAAKYSEKPSRIWLAVESNGDEVAIRVRDEGIGIDPRILPNIFKLFVQGDVSLAHASGGLGIGLTLVQRIVQLHDGRVVASSEGLGKGSEFIVYLPLVPEAQVQEKGILRDAGKNRRASQRRVLVVDDNVDAASTVTQLLKLWGHDVQAVFNGEAALEAAKQFRPEIVLLDIGLPGMSGYDVARTLRSQPEFKDVLIAALTGYGQHHDRQRSYLAGFDHHLTKPPDPALLEAIINSPESFMQT